MDHEIRLRCVEFVGGGPIDGAKINVPEVACEWRVPPSVDSVYKSADPPWAVYEIMAGYGVFKGYA